MKKELLFILTLIFSLPFCTAITMDNNLTNFAQEVYYGTLFFFSGMFGPFLVLVIAIIIVLIILLFAYLFKALARRV